jgi:hypothetical protein
MWAFDMSTWDDVLTEISRFCEEQGIAETTFGRLAVNNSRFVQNVRKENARGSTIWRAQRYMAKHRATNGSANGSSLKESVADVTAIVDGAASYPQGENPG